MCLLIVQHMPLTLPAVCTLQFSIAANMIRNQGVGSLYKGLSAGLLRQATYTTARLGIYNNIFEAAKKMNDNKVGCMASMCALTYFHLHATFLLCLTFSSGKGKQDTTISGASLACSPCRCGRRRCAA